MATRKKNWFDEIRPLSESPLPSNHLATKETCWAGRGNEERQTRSDLFATKNESILLQQRRAEKACFSAKFTPCKTRGEREGEHDPISETSCGRLAGRWRLAGEEARVEAAAGRGRGAGWPRGGGQPGKTIATAVAGRRADHCGLVPRPWQGGTRVVAGLGAWPERTPRRGWNGGTWQDGAHANVGWQADSGRACGGPPEGRAHVRLTVGMVCGRPTAGRASGRPIAKGPAAGP